MVSWWLGMPWPPYHRRGLRGNPDPPVVGTSPAPARLDGSARPRENGSVKIVGAGAILLLALAAVTLLALEGREVVVVRTVQPDGTSRDTRTWIADADGVVWIEAANPERPFLQDVRTRPEVTLRRHGALSRCRADVVPDPDGHARVRRLLTDRYGWADRWIGLFADTSRSVALRLACNGTP
jgi:hypothetical protein